MSQITGPENSQIASEKTEPAAIPTPAAQVSPYQLAEEAWEELISAAAKIQAAANAIKKTERTVDGYNMERTLNKHKPHLMPEHLANLREHRKTNKL